MLLQEDKETPVPPPPHGVELLIPPHGVELFQALHSIGNTELMTELLMTLCYIKEMEEGLFFG